MTMRVFYRNEIRPSVQNVINKCEDEFEKKTLYIAAGSLGLSLSFVVDLESRLWLWLLLFGWSMLVGCILINLVSQLLPRHFAEKTLKDIDDECQKSREEFDPNDINTKITKRNVCTKRINYTTTVFLILGIGFVLAYAGINIANVQNMKEDVTTPQHGETWIDTIDTGKHPGDVEINAGISMPMPAMPKDQIKTQPSNKTKK